MKAVLDRIRADIGGRKLEPIPKEFYDELGGELDEDGDR